MSEMVQSPSSDVIAKAQESLAAGDIYNARKILEAAAPDGGPDIANALGEVIASQPGRSSAADAARWFQRAADAGYAPAHLNVALMLCGNREGVANDPEKALFHLRCAAEAGIPAAMVQLALLMESRIGFPSEPSAWAESREWLEKAAAAGSADGAIALARYLDNGLGGETDPARATELLFAASEAGSALAMNEIGVRYQKGTGIRLDRVSAIGWFTRASQLGLPAAYVNLGNCYENGIGLQPDIRRAGESYAAAAKMNHPIAQYLLGRMFEEGRGTAVNLTFAFVNYCRAAAQGVEAAAERRDAVRGSLNLVEFTTAEKLLRGNK